MNLRLIFSMCCPGLALATFLIGSSMGLPALWLDSLFVSLIVTGVAVSIKKPRPTGPSVCRFNKRNGERCKRTVAAAGDFCFQHQHGISAKLKAIPRNPAASFYINFALSAASVALTIAPWFATPSKTPTAIPSSASSSSSPPPPTSFSATVQ